MVADIFGTLSVKNGGGLGVKNLCGRSLPKLSIVVKPIPQLKCGCLLNVEITMLQRLLRSSMQASGSETKELRDVSLK
ncbi:hypothetical protein HAX54_030062 [Datura stramonium]|uniref:Uncharacterized protein n=1 Tax=Datura stramonium TaxID=4076 RepID=A0ABS8SAN3_DATST|nr:hypothetical protein [Datura stramonium]